MHVRANFCSVFCEINFLNRQIQLMNPETTPADDEPPSCRDPIYLIFSGICHNYKGLG